MKLILCKKCQDVVRLIKNNVRRCECGSCSGQYVDDLNAWYKGIHAIPMGFNNSSAAKAIRNQPKNGWGVNFDAFVIAKECKTFKNNT